jgi:erythromycin esterase-like protein
MSLSSRLAMSSATVALLSVAAPVTQRQRQQSVVEWIRANAIPLKTVEAGHGFADMEPLRKVVGDARIVALGEATHGSREFFQLKHRMLEFLASRMGFTIFAIEANMPEAYRLNDYVLTGTGDPAALLKGMYFWTWDTEEVLAMIHWMREFNASGKGRVMFTGFDMQTPTVAAKIVDDFVAKVEPAYEPTVRAASSMAEQVSKGNTIAPDNGFAAASGAFPVDAAAGKRVRYSGFVKTDGITRGYAGLWWRVDGDSGVVAFDNMADRGLTGTTDWQRCEIALSVPANARRIAFGVLHPGDGTAWFSGLAVELDGRPYTSATIDLGLDAWPLRGLAVRGVGYQGQPDSSVTHDGHPTLQIRYLGTPAATATSAASATPPVNPKTADSTWRDIVAHLQAARTTATPADAAWALQNARVVLQGIQNHANPVIRDVSMAENIEWILDQNPNAKIVVWAHNEHVSTAPTGRPMGSVLRSRYGSQMVAFGFAFNQGGFQAVEPQKALREFTVGPAESGSFDATLAATGIPVFALDLRRAPKTGPVAEWLAAPHRSRSIGSMYSEPSSFAYYRNRIAPEAFDAVLFVETTTTARKNPK